jgi:hypothetical protein
MDSLKEYCKKEKNYDLQNLSTIIPISLRALPPANVIYNMNNSMLPYVVKLNLNQKNPTKKEFAHHVTNELKKKDLMKEAYVIFKMIDFC